MNGGIDILHGELERLFSLEELTSLTERLLGLDPERVGGAHAKATFARALTERCRREDRLDALVDAVLASKRGADPRLALLPLEELGAPGPTLGDFALEEAIDEGVLVNVYRARRDGRSYLVEMPTTTAWRDGRAVQRFLTAHRLLSLHAGGALPVLSVHGEGAGSAFVALEIPSGETLASRVQRRGPLRVREAAPLVERLLEALARIHEARLWHGELSLERVFVTRGDDTSAGDAKLFGFARDRLTFRASLPPSAKGFLALVGPARPVAPEVLRGTSADARADVYNLGALLYELFTGTPVFPAESAADAALAHLGREPERPSRRAVGLGLASEVDDFLLELLRKDPAARPADAGRVLEAFRRLLRPSLGALSSDGERQPRLDALAARLKAEPSDEEAALLLEQAAEEGADPVWVAEALVAAEERLGVEDEKDDGAELVDERELLTDSPITAEERTPRAPEATVAARAADAAITSVGVASADETVAVSAPVDDAPADDAPALVDAAALEERAQDEARRLALRKALVFRAARILEGAGRVAEAAVVLARVRGFAPDDEVALRSLVRLHRNLGQLDEAVELLVSQVERSRVPADRARLLVEVARLYADDLADAAQALVAYGSALAEVPTDGRIAQEIERLAGTDLALWTELLSALAPRVQAPELTETERVALFVRLGRWYDERAGRPDAARYALDEALRLDPAHDEARTALAGVLRRAEQWPELVATLLAHADALPPGPQTRALRVEAADVLADKLYEGARARRILEALLEEDPGHDEAAATLERILEGAGEHDALLELLERRAELQDAPARARSLLAAGEIAEMHQRDLATATRLYEAVLVLDARSLPALAGLERVHEAEGHVGELLFVLERQAELAVTPRQKVALLERVAALQESEFLDARAAAATLEILLTLDPHHEAALLSLGRQYEKLGRWEDLVGVREKQAALAVDPGRRIEALLSRARVYRDELASAERAMAAYEDVLEVEPHHEGALAALAHLREKTGDARAAAEAFERLAAKTSAPQARATHLVQAARILDAAGDGEGALERFARAFEAAPEDEAAVAGLRRAYERRGDDAALATLLARAAAAAPSALARARLLCDRAVLLSGPLGQHAEAVGDARAALALDPSLAVPTLVLADVAFGQGDIEEASKLYEALVPRAMTLPRSEGLRVALRYLEAAEALRVEPSSSRETWPAPPSGRASMPSLTSLASLGGATIPPAPSLGSLSAADLGETSAAPTTLPNGVAAPSSLAASVPPPAASVAPSSVSSSMLPASMLPASVVPASVVPSSGPTSTPARIRAALEVVRTLGADDARALFVAARAAFVLAEPNVARPLAMDLVSRLGAHLTDAERAMAHFWAGEGARRLGDLTAAERDLEEATSLDPSRVEAFIVLCLAFEAHEKWPELARTLERRLETALGDERFALLLRLGDLELQKLGDKARAARSYGAALEERPGDRNLLTRLMALYAEDKDWDRLVDVVVRLSGFVDDGRQRAKYLHTAAIVCARQLGDTEQALRYYDDVLAADPMLTRALDEALELRKARGEHDEVRKLLERRLEDARRAGQPQATARALDELGALYERGLLDVGKAIDAYEAAQALVPDDRAREETLASLYAKDPERYLDKAVRAQMALLRRSPLRAESYKLLRKLYTESKRADDAWRLCQTLAVLHLAEPDEERFYLRHRSDTAAPAQAVLGEADWGELLAHPDADVRLTRLFALIEPTVVRTRNPPLEALGYDAHRALDLAEHAAPVCQTLHYARTVLGLPTVAAFHNSNDGAPLGFVHARTPAVLLGARALDLRAPAQAITFVVARHLSYFVPGHYVRHLVPTGTGLKAWLFAAIRMSVPTFPIAPELQGPVQEATAALATDFIGAARDRLASAVSKLLQAEGALDLKRWVSGIDATADRAGLLLCHDLAVALDTLRLAEGREEALAQARVKELVLFAASPQYGSLRRKLGVTID